MITDISFSDAEKLDNGRFIDVRSENEFLEATIPGAMNVPLFNNEERARVGTVYKQQGAEKARELGLHLVSPKLPDLTQQIRTALKPDQIPIFFCWRGGMRSKSLAIFYDLVYPNVYRLEGGYRGYRQYILEQIPKLTLDMPVFVLHGMTGVAKTSLLYQLKEMGISIIDLEGLAGHRGSAFGAVGKVNPVNQKTFDSNIYQTLKEIQGANAVVLEAESKRIGKVMIPDHIITAKENGHHILVKASIETRVKRIIDEYQPYDHFADIHASWMKIEKRLPTEIRQLIHTALKENDFHTVTTLLLQYYYDPRYQYSTDQYQGDFFTVYSDDFNHAAEEIYRFIQSSLKKRPYESVNT